MNSGLHDISSLIKNEILGFIASPEASEIGRVMQVGDGIVHAIGLDNVIAGNLSASTTT
jgi:F0F1-type ATP synthase alpha subunit